MNQFLQDVLKGLSASPKYLESKYFYDEEGDKIFEEIMQCPEYYLTDCELEIFSKQTPQLASALTNVLSEFDIVELGPGNALKSKWLLKCLQDRNMNFTYYPIDISKNVIESLQSTLPVSIPGIKICGLNGEYFKMLGEVKKISSRNKVVLFLGSSIGNIPLEKTAPFFVSLKEHLLPGDVVLTGFDLKKDPSIILAAYNDKKGITRRFNLNLLKRINSELGADFDISKFDHRPVYDEELGACKSYLVSKEEQEVHISGTIIRFSKNESVFMEIAQKYDPEQLKKIATNAGFKSLFTFFDNRHWFLDAIWQAKD
jgi:dimethylhistidine N-methyltransferase